MPERTPDGRWAIFRTGTGERVLRWPVDARGMLESGEFVEHGPEAEPDAETVAATAEPAAAHADSPPATPVAGLHAGYRVEQAGTWHTLYGPDGEKVGKAQRSEADAWKQVPGPDGLPLEHSPGVPLNPTWSGDASPAEPVKLPEPGGGRASGRASKRGG